MGGPRALEISGKPFGRGRRDAGIFPPVDWQVSEFTCLRYYLVKKIVNEGTWRGGEVALRFPPFEAQGEQGVNSVATGKTERYAWDLLRFEPVENFFWA